MDFGMNYNENNPGYFKNQTDSIKNRNPRGGSQKSIRPWILAAGLLSTTLGETSAMAADPIVKPTQQVLISQAGDVSQDFPYKFVVGTECAGGKCGTISGTKEHYSDPTCTNCNPKSKMEDQKTLGTSQGSGIDAVPSGTGHVPPPPPPHNVPLVGVQYPVRYEHETTDVYHPPVYVQPAPVYVEPAPVYVEEETDSESLSGEEDNDNFIDAPDPQIIVKGATRDAILINTPILNEIGSSALRRVIPVSVEEGTDSESLSGEEDNASGTNADDEEIPVEHSLEETDSESDVYSEEYSNGYLEDGEDLNQNNEEDELSTDSHYPEDVSKNEESLGGNEIPGANGDSDNTGGNESLGGNESDNESLGGNESDSESDANDQSVTNDFPDYSASFESMFRDGADNTSTNDGDNGVKTD